jgi:hypothetical protein
VCWPSLVLIPLGCKAKPNLFPPLRAPHCSLCSITLERLCHSASSRADDEHPASSQPPAHEHAFVLTSSRAATELLRSQATGLYLLPWSTPCRRTALAPALPPWVPPCPEAPQRPLQLQPLTGVPSVPTAAAMEHLLCWAPPLLAAPNEFTPHRSHSRPPLRPTSP